MRHDAKRDILLRAYGACVALIAISAFVAYTPAGNRLAPPGWAWIAAALLLAGTVFGLLLIVALMGRARRAGRSGASRAMLLLPMLAAMATCTLAPLPVHTVSVDGLERSYRVFTPNDYDGTRPLPLILVLHGFMQDWRSIRTLARFDRIGGREGALIVYPSGYRRSWNDGDDSKPATNAGMDDAAFLRQVIDRVSQTHNVDARRVYAVGFSNSGFLLVRHACALTDKIAAIGVVAAGVYPLWDGACAGGERVAAMFIIGSADPMLASLQRFDVEPSRSGELWGQANGCRDHAVLPVADRLEDGTRSTRTEFTHCIDGASVVALRVERGGHTWPGGPQYLPAALVGRTGRDFDATEQLWAFFSDARAPEPRGTDVRGPDPPGH